MASPTDPTRPSDAPADPGDPGDPDGPRRDRTVLWVVALVAAVALIVGLVALLGGDGDDDEDLDVADDVTTTTETTIDEATTTTTAPTTTETMTPPVDVDLDAPVFPDPLTSQRFTDPVAAVNAFATELVGMVDPVIGDLQEGDSRSGEVEVRPLEDGPVTTVLVRQLEDDSWFVIGAVTTEVELDEPENGAEVDDPIELRGRARAFEGTVPVRVLADGVGEVGEGFVTGSGGPDLGPFEGEVDIDVPDGVTHGVVLLITEGGEDMVPWTVTAVRVRFSG
jgi:hypothetical protein